MGERDRWTGIWRSGKPKTKGTGGTRRRDSTRMTRVALASAVAVAVALGAGVASASIDAPAGKIPGCHPTLTGRLRDVVGQPGARCRNEKRLYIASFSTAAVGTSPTQVAVLKHVPAGAYLVSVAGQATDHQSDNNFIPQLTCSLTPSTTSYTPDSLPVGNPPIGEDTVSIVAGGDSVLTTAGTITFSCQAADLAPPPSNPTLQGVITAIPVEGVS
jgi:hypothetical protein